MDGRPAVAGDARIRWCVVLGVSDERWEALERENERLERENARLQRKVQELKAKNARCLEVVAMVAALEQGAR